MYITINGVRYENAKRTQTARRVTYLSPGITADIVAEGTVGEYRNDGFLLREVDVGAYSRQIAQEGVLTLTNEPEAALVETDPTADELLDILLGGDEG